MTSLTEHWNSSSAMHAMSWPAALTGRRIGSSSTTAFVHAVNVSISSFCSRYADGIVMLISDNAPVATEFADHSAERGFSHAFFHERPRRRTSLESARRGLSGAVPQFAACRVLPDTATQTLGRVYSTTWRRVTETRLPRRGRH